jgi:hypothetical protein
MDFEAVQSRLEPGSFVFSTQRWRFDKARHTFTLGFNRTCDGRAAIPIRSISYRIAQNRLR